LSNPNGDFLRSLALLFLAVAGASAVVWFTSSIIGTDSNGALGQAFKALATSPWALPAVIALFTAASFVGIPQFILIALAVAAFGPLRGFAFAYIASLISASVNFLLARYLGIRWRGRNKPGRGMADTIPEINAHPSTLKTISELVGQNGFFTAMIVRIIPSAPFVVVNMALALTTMPYVTFLAGTAVGTIPKTALIAVLGKVVERAGTGETDAIIYLGLAAFGWAALAYVAKVLLKRYKIDRRAP